VVSRAGAGGDRDGECLRFRADGTLFSRTRYVAGVEEGPFVIYHPDGRVAREGTLVGGRIDGKVVAYAAAADGPRGEPLRACCVPPKAARLDARYRGGELLLEVFYDSEGRALLSDGRLCPPRPPGLPELADFDEARGAWMLRTRELDRCWTQGGVLLQENALVPDGGRLVRTLDPSGALAEEERFAPDGKREGPFLRRLQDGAVFPYADRRVREERGAFARGQAVGTWTFLDGGGALLRTVERGLPFAAVDVAASPAFAPALPDGWALARALVGEGRVREGLCAAARAAARPPEGDRAALEAFLDAHVMPLAPDEAAARGATLARTPDLDAATILDELVQGADAAAVFRALAGVLPGINPAAAELVEASLLLAPERRATHLTRAILRAQRGDEAGAHEDAACLDGDGAGGGEGMRAYLRVVFRPFPFAPAAETLVPDPALDVIPAGIVQPLAAIRRVAGVYATRLARVRAAVRAVVTPPLPADGAAEPGWMPPDPSALLPDGEVALRKERVACDPEPAPDGGDAPPGEPDFIEIDEELATDGLTVTALLAVAHADWNALCWLCWAAGLDRVALPVEVAPPDTLAVAMQMAVKRHWRAHDRTTTGGLLALSNGVPGFTWEGMDIDAVPPHFVSTVVAEYLAVRSMFLWLASPDTLSPFQDDIRQA
jgi:antitoxin component YwqK of YwqJK toxin-antitoxin module